MDIKSEVFSILDEVLCLKGEIENLGFDTPLLGAVPELDSMTVVALICLLEERFGLEIGDDEIDGATFATVRTLVDFVQTKREALLTRAQLLSHSE